MFKKVLIANRGAIAARILRTLKEMNIKTVVVYSTADQHLPYLKEADETYHLEGNTAQETYLDQEKLLDIVKRTGVDAVHPGYGFLAENESFVKKLEEHNVKFIGPTSKYITLMADKHDARELMKKYNMPVGEGSAILNEKEEDVKEEARKVGYPVLVKPANGGGGIGMLAVYEEEKLMKSVERARGMAEKFFDDSSIYLEKYFEEPRHIEYQIIADQFGNVKQLYERDCSMQRRHQKILEESPAPGITEEERMMVGDKIEKAIQAIGYDNIGTVEMLRARDGSYSFLEMNTRLQVEHAVTEEVLNIDLVKMQVKSAAGQHLEEYVPSTLSMQGHCIEARIYAEDPINFYPSPGTLHRYHLPERKGVRVETGFEEGNIISPYYDPMIAKVIVHATNRTEAIQQLANYLSDVQIEGVKTNIPFIIYALKSEAFREGRIHTKLVDELVAMMKEEKKGEK